MRSGRSRPRHLRAFCKRKAIDNTQGWPKPVWAGLGTITAERGFSGGFSLGLLVRRSMNGGII
jgi:hypothetical protein